MWQHDKWPAMDWDAAALLVPLGKCRKAQGGLLAMAEHFNLDVQAEVLTHETLNTAAIEGEKLDRQSVRSSIARRLGLPTAGLPAVQRPVEGLVEMLLDATIKHNEPLTEARLKAWHGALFPTGYSGMRQITVGGWRNDNEGPMQVVSGPVAREVVHFEAPPARRLKTEIKKFLAWWNGATSLDGLIRAGMAHLWFVTLHPFDDGNGRIARAITDMALAQDEALDARMYSMSAQIIKERDAYYENLEHTQKGNGDITEWLSWFLSCAERAMEQSKEQLEGVLEKNRFWQKAAVLPLNARQIKAVNRLLDAGPDGFTGGLTNRKYQSMTRASSSTAKRDIAELITLGLLKRNAGGGRSVSYSLARPGSE